LAKRCAKTASSAFASPWAAGSTTELTHPVLGPTTQVVPPFHLSRTPATVRTPPPLPGEDADGILAELGYENAEIEALRSAGIA